MKKTCKSSNSLINVMRLCVFCSCVLAIFHVCFRGFDVLPESSELCDEPKT